MGASVDPNRGRVDIVEALRSAFREAFGRSDVAVIARAPGRVNLIGDHTDYNDGFVLPMTIDRAVYACAAPRSDGIVRLYSANYGDQFEYAPAEGRDDSSSERRDDSSGAHRVELADERRHDAMGEPQGNALGEPQADARGAHSSVHAHSWRSYVTGAIEELRVRGVLPGGFDLLIYGDVPLGAGLSSSAALTVSTVLGLQALFAFDLDPVDAIRLCRLVEHRYAGVPCGIMDQFASRLGRRDHALFLDCRSLEHEHLPLPLVDAGLALVIINSGISRSLARSKYMERRQECDKIVEELQHADPSIRALRDVGTSFLDAEESRLDAVLRRRARHVVEENARVVRAREMLRSGNYDAFGGLMNDSHASLRDLYEVSIPELDALAFQAQQVRGVLGARMTGAGFGGCTVNLVRADAVDRLSARIDERAGEHLRDVLVLTGNLEADVLLVDGERRA